MTRNTTITMGTLGVTLEVTRASRNVRVTTTTRTRKVLGGARHTILAKTSIKIGSGRIRNEFKI